MTKFCLSLKNNLARKKKRFMNEHATQSLGYCLIGKIQHVSYKIGTFFSK